MAYQIPANAIASMLLVFYVALVFSACENESQHRQYTEVEINARLGPAPSKTAQMNGMLGSSKPVPRTVDWQLPSGWKEIPSTGMRMGAFSIPSGSDSVIGSVIGMAGDAGGLKANIVRWMQQLSLPSYSEEQLAGFISKLPNFKSKYGFNGKIVDFTSILSGNLLNNQSALVGIISLKKSQIFIKLTGPRNLLKKNRSAFAKFCTTIHPKP